MKRAMERHEAKEARVIPIILKPVDWSGATFGKLQALPKNAKPITTWSNRDEAFLNVAQGIRRVVEEIAKGKASAKVAPAPSVASSSPSVAASPSSNSSGLTDRQRRRLEQQRDSLQQDYDLISTKLSKLRQAYLIETDVAVKLKLEVQIQETQAELDRVEQQLDEIEQKLD